MSLAIVLERAVSTTVIIKNGQQNSVWANDDKVNRRIYKSSDLNGL